MRGTGLTCCCQRTPGRVRSQNNETVLTRTCRTSLAVTLALIDVVGPGRSALGAPPRGACISPSAPGKQETQVPWAQKTLGPERAWPFSTGAGVLVAVIDSGVDTDHPQLSAPGKVLPGYDFIRHKPDADFDCISHGTAVASIIAASRRSGIGFHGVAPDAKILPIRVSEAEPDDSNTAAAVKPAVFATAIRYAADHGASVINLSVVMYTDVPAVRAAVAYAERKGALLVAAVGNQHQDNGTDQTPYPAAYPGVIGVGAVTIDNSRLDASQVGPYVDLVAPGGGVLAATREHGYLFWDGTSFATPFVSATAALVRAEYPRLSAAAVTNRLLATADPAPGGPDSTAYGHGMVNPYRAVTEGLTGANPIEVPAPLATPKPDLAAERRAARARNRAVSAVHIVVVLTLLAGCVALVVAVRPRRRR